MANDDVDNANLYVCNLEIMMDAPLCPYGGRHRRNT